MRLALAAALVAAAHASCSPEMQALWVGSREFADAYQQAGAQAQGAAEATKSNMRALYPLLSEECAACLGESSRCAATECTAECAGNPGGPDCLKCTNLKGCNYRLNVCVGVGAVLPLDPVDQALPTAAPTTDTPTQAQATASPAVPVASEPSAAQPTQAPGVVTTAGSSVVIIQGPNTPNATVDGEFGNVTNFDFSDDSSTTQSPVTTRPRSNANGLYSGLLPVLLGTLAVMACLA